MMGNLATMLESLGQLDEALSLAREAYERRSRTMGESHPDTLLNADGLIDRLLEAGKPEEALNLARSSYATAQKALEPADTTRHNLGRSVVLALARLARHEEALAEARLVAAAHVETLGPESPDTFIAQDLVAQELISLNRIDEAEPIARDTYERSLRSDRISARMRRTLAMRLVKCLEAQDRLQEAETIRATTRPSPVTTMPSKPTTTPAKP